MTKGQISRHVKLAGMGRALADGETVFAGETRYRLKAGETLLDLAEEAAGKALAEAGMDMGDVDCIVCAMGTPLQI